MPNMSGFELLAILGRRFPHIPVIVISGEFIVHTDSPGMLMNAFFRKAEYTPPQLISTLRDLYSQRPLRPALTRQSRAPLWINRRSSDYLPCHLHRLPAFLPHRKSQSHRRSLAVHRMSLLRHHHHLSVDSSVLRILELQQAAVPSHSALLQIPASSAD